MKDRKPWLGLALKQDFAKGRGRKPKVKKRTCLNWETCELTSVTQTYGRRGSEGGAPSCRMLLGPGNEVSSSLAIFLEYF